MVISVDFDGTCVTHDYPNLGNDIGAEIVLEMLCKSGHKIICTTMRHSEDKKRHGVDTIHDIKLWFEKHNIELYAINDNPEQHVWSGSRKIYANLYIDDQALGIPLLYNAEISDRHFVNWQGVATLLYKIGVLSTNECINALLSLHEKYPSIYPKH